MRALIVGIDSQIGSALAIRLRMAGIAVIGTSRRSAANGGIVLDIAQSHAVSLPPTNIAFLCAAETRQLVCRNDPAGTQRINVDAQVALAKRLAAQGTRIVFTSSNAVFDGRMPYRLADETTCPITTYGQQKAEAERRLLALDGAVCVVRLTKTLSLEFSLIRNWIAELTAGHPIYPFADLVMAPMPAAYVCDVLLAIATSSPTGIFQASGLRDISYREAARRVATRLGFDEGRVMARNASGTQIPASEIPAHTTLNSSRVVELIGYAPPDPLAVIDEIVDHLATKCPAARESATPQSGSGL